MAEPMTPAELAGTRLSLEIGRDYKPEVVAKLLATVEARDELIRDLRYRCRYVDRREAEHVKARIAETLGETLGTGRVA